MKYLGRIAEYCYPFLISIGAGVAAHSCANAITESKFSNLLSVAVSVASILMGFLGTAKTMLLSFKSPRFSWIKSNKAAWNGLMGYFRWAMLSNLILCLYCLMLLPFTLETQQVGRYFVGWSVLASFSLLSFYRVLHLIFSLLAGEGAKPADSSAPP